MPYKDPAKRKVCHDKWVRENADRNREHKRKWREENIEQHRAANREYSARTRVEYPEKTREKNRLWMRVWTARNRDVANGRSREQYAKHRDKRRVARAEYNARPDVVAAVNRRARDRRKTDPQYRLACGFRSAVSEALRGKSKSARTMELIGCSVQHAMAHLESQFRNGMSWDTYGRRGWHIDHIRPLAWFDLTVPEQQRQAFHWTNLQPLWWYENMSKGARWAGKAA